MFLNISTRSIDDTQTGTTILGASGPESEENGYIPHSS